MNGPAPDSTPAARAAAAPAPRVRSAGRSRAQQVYDVIVLGTELAGLLAGALLMKRGLRVLHIDTDGRSVFYESGGYRLPWAPAVFPPLKRMPAGEAALGEIGSAVDVHRALNAGQAGLQVLLPGHRFEVAQDPARTAAELERESDAQTGARLAGLVEAIRAAAERTDDFFRAPAPLPPRGLLERWQLRRALRRCPALRHDEKALQTLAGHPLGAGMMAVAAFLSALEPAEGSLARLRPLGQVLGTAHAFPWGLAGLRELMRRRLLELGAARAGGPGEPARVEELTFDRARSCAVRLVDSRVIHRAHQLIASLPHPALAPLLPPRVLKRGLGKRMGLLRPARIRVTANLVFRAAGLPVGLRDLAVLQSSDRELGPVLLEVLPARQGERIVPDEKVICAAAHVRAPAGPLPEPALRELAERVEAAVLEIAPFADSYRVHRSVPLLDGGDDRAATLHEATVLEVDGPGALGVGGLPQRLGGNLILASRENLPGLGLEGELLAGVRAAALVQQSLHKHDPLK